VSCLERGCAEKRIRLAVPPELSRLQDPVPCGNVRSLKTCSFGVRLLIRQAMGPNEQLMVSSSMGDLRIKARVVYCQPLPCGGLAVGLRFQGVAANFLLATRGETGNVSTLHVDRCPLWVTQRPNARIDSLPSSL